MVDVEKSGIKEIMLYKRALKEPAYSPFLKNYMSYQKYYLVRKFIELKIRKIRDRKAVSTFSTYSHPVHPTGISDLT